jgi:tRNA (guanine26-N2/guanine27-N2)-dimethyltransferase
MYGSQKRLYGLVYALSQELPEPPLFLSLDSMCGTIHVTQPSLNAIRSAIVSRGYPVSISHTHPLALKTTAPQGVVSR